MVGDPVLVQVVVEVSFFDVCALDGRGGEGSCVGRCGAVGGGWPGRRCFGWRFGGARDGALWPCSFIGSRLRRAAADDSCGPLLFVAVLSPWWLEVRRRRRRPGSWVKTMDPIVFPSVCSGCFVQVCGVLL